MIVETWSWVWTNDEFGVDMIQNMIRRNSVINHWNIPTSIVTCFIINDRKLKHGSQIWTIDDFSFDPIGNMIFVWEKSKTYQNSMIKT